jgi:hypothetical protein
MKKSIILVAIAAIGCVSLKGSPFADHMEVIVTTNDPLMIKAFGKNNTFDARKISSAKQIYVEDFSVAEHGNVHEGHITAESEIFEQYADNLGKGLGFYYVIEAPQKDRVCVMYDTAGKKWVYYKLNNKTKPLDYLTYKDDVDYSKNSNNSKQTVKRMSGATDRDVLLVKVVNNNISIELVKADKFKELKISTRATREGALLNASFPAGFENRPID